MRPTSGPSISGNKYDRDKLIFSAERGGSFQSCVIKYGPNQNLKNGHHHRRTSIPCPSMGVHVTGIPGISFNFVDLQ